MIAPTLERLDGVSSAPEPDEEPDAFLAEARRRAQGADRDGAESWLTATRLVADALAGAASSGDWTATDVETLVGGLARTTGMSVASTRRALFRETLHALQTRNLPPAATIEAVLAAVVALAPVTEASLWLRRDGIECIAFRGAVGPTRRGRAAAAAVLRGQAASATQEQALVHAVPVLRWNRPLAALVVKTKAAERAIGLVYAEEAAEVLGPPLAYEILLERGANRERALVQASERRLTRIGFDIHDGPLQEIAALAADLRLFRAQLGGIDLEAGLPQVLLERLDDFDARLVELDGDLRELAHSLESPSAIGRPLGELLRRHAAALEKRSGIAVVVDVRGDVEGLTPSQRLAVVRIVQEALTNVREHSGARSVSVHVTAGRTHTEAIVTDDGRGFEVERTLVRAAHRGRLGLVGMAERVRLLGGRLEVESRPGGPTTIAATLPRWQPLGVAQSAPVRAA